MNPNNPPTSQDGLLKPCPFCKGDGAWCEVENDGYAQVMCVCTAYGPLRKGEADAIAAWNESSQ
jgi:hypothetical protein